ncbi:MAG: hypothetical protein ACTSU5_11720 [Promethearchaeota archaeon]
MSKILEKRNLTIQILRKLSASRDTFTINDLKEELNLPRSTVQDWVSRFLEDGTITVVSEASGRKPAIYKYSEKPFNPCKKILTAVDEENHLVEIYHFCESIGARFYCSDEYRKQGLVYSCDPTGSFLRQKARIGRSPIELRSSPKTSIGIEEITLEDGFVIQTIKSIVGGPAVALTSTMDGAKGVLNVQIEDMGDHVVGKVRTREYRRVVVGIDDTDVADDISSATWEISMKLMSILEDTQGIEALSHKLVRLNPNITKTGGNVAAFLELAVLPNILGKVKEKTIEFLKENTSSDETAIAIFEGLEVPVELVEFAKKVRREVVSVTEAKSVAERLGIELVPITGERGMIGALATIPFVYATMEQLMNPHAELK